MCREAGLGMLKGLAMREVLSNPLFSLWRWYQGRNKPIEGILCSPCCPAPGAAQPCQSSLVHGSCWLSSSWPMLPAQTFVKLPVLPTLPCLTHSICTRRSAKGLLEVFAQGLDSCAGKCVIESNLQLVLEWKPACLLSD